MYCSHIYLFISQRSVPEQETNLLYIIFCVNAIWNQNLCRHWVLEFKVFYLLSIFRKMKWASTKQKEKTFYSVYI